jgi:hypothetical protein
MYSIIAGKSYRAISSQLHMGDRFAEPSQNLSVLPKLPEFAACIFQPQMLHAKNVPTEVAQPHVEALVGE